jgi:hypothetical protein
MTGGAGGANTSMMGGASGAIPCTQNAILDGPDAQQTKDVVFCTPECIYRPNWPGRHTCGPANSVYRAVAMKSDGFCGAQYNKDGIFMVPRSFADSNARNQAASGETVNVAGVRAYLPGGTAKYMAAADGQVALSFWTSGFAGDSGTHKIENIHEYLVKENQIPYTIAIFIGNDKSGPDRIAELRTLIPMLKARWPKISNDPNYRSIAGQSTAGADAFDTVWLGTDVIAKAIGGSASVACFTCMGGQGLCAEAGCPGKNDSYVKEVEFCHARPIRFTTTVGSCDIFGSLAERLAAGCGGASHAGAVDASQCGATWLTINTNLANALKAKGMPYQLFVVEGAGHAPGDWSIGLSWQLRWAFKDIACKM